MTLPRALSSFFLTLIPKVKSPHCLGDFRPISLIGSLYKLIAKVLAKRLSTVIGTVIAPNQSAFIKDRHLVDGVIVANEVLDFAKRKRLRCLALKVDFEKAYDTVNWGFLLYMLKRFGCDSKWISWMQSCICSGNLSILVNGCPTDEFAIQRGLKQGDPLAPLLFTLVAEALGKLISKAVHLGKFQGIKIGEEVISHLQYADDTLILGEATYDNLWTIKGILRWFELCSGLKVNFSKSNLIGINVDDNFLNAAEQFLGCKRGGLPFKFLGLQVEGNHKKSVMWDGLLNSLNRKLASWKYKNVSFGGRIVLLKAVLNSIPIFHLSVWKMPLQVWKSIISLQRRFLWGGTKLKNKMAWVRWDEICRPILNGGLGIRNLRIVNLSLLSKWCWRLVQEEDALWKRVLKARYGENVCLFPSSANITSQRNVSPWWKDIRSIGSLEGLQYDWLQKSIIRKVGCGLMTRFWDHLWLGDYTLKARFPRLYSLAVSKEMSVASARSFASDSPWTIPWRCNLFQWELDLVSHMQHLLNFVALNQDIDKWWWVQHPSGLFSVSSAYEYLSSQLQGSHLIQQAPMWVLQRLWSSLAPPKVIAFSWQLLRNRIPTRDNLLWRNIIAINHDISCVWCASALETATHLFIRCDSVLNIWYAVFRWLGWSVAVPSDLQGLFSLFVGLSYKKKIQQGLALIWHSVVWSLWTARNRCFDNVPVVWEAILDRIISLSWRWFLARANAGVVLYYEWFANPMLCLSRK